MPGDSMIEQPWDKMTDDEKQKTTEWAESVIALSRRIDQLSDEIDDALARQDGHAGELRSPAVRAADMERMRGISDRVYRSAGCPGHGSAGGPVDWDCSDRPAEEPTP